MSFIFDIFAADKAADAQKDVSRDQIAASTEATDKTLALQKDIFDRIWNGTAVQREAGDAATRLMSQIMGLNLPSANATGGGAGGPQTQPPTGPQVMPRPAGPVGPLGPGGSQPTGPVQQFNALSGGDLALGSAKTMPVQASMAAPQGTGPQVMPQSVAAAAGGPVAVPGETGPQIMPLPGAGGGGDVTTAGNALEGASGAPFDVTAWLRSTPGYDANYTSGMRALNTGLASQGRLFSGDAGREATRYGQEYADRILGDQFNRLGVIAGSGQTATSQGGQAGANYANQSGNALMSNAGNLSSSYQNRGNAISGFWGDMAGTFGSDAGARMAGTAMKAFGGF